RRPASHGPYQPGAAERNLETVADSRRTEEARQRHYHLRRYRLSRPHAAVRQRGLRVPAYKITSSWSIVGRPEASGRPFSYCTTRCLRRLGALERGLRV